VRAHAQGMSTTDPFRPNLPQPADDGAVRPDDDLAIDEELAAEGGLDVDGAPVVEGESRADDDLAD
jgi:hypothetical protein